MLMYAEELKDIPSVIIMEPSLLMHTFKYETKYWNWNYQVNSRCRDLNKSRLVNF